MFDNKSDQNLEEFNLFEGSQPLNHDYLKISNPLNSGCSGWPEGPLLILAGAGLVRQKLSLTESLHLIKMVSHLAIFSLTTFHKQGSSGEMRRYYRSIKCRQNLNLPLHGVCMTATNHLYQPSFTWCKYT